MMTRGATEISTALNTCQKQADLNMENRGELVEDSDNIEYGDNQHDKEHQHEVYFEVIEQDREGCVLGRIYQEDDIFSHSLQGMGGYNRVGSVQVFYTHVAFNSSILKKKIQ